MMRMLHSHLIKKSCFRTENKLLYLPSSEIRNHLTPVRDVALQFAEANLNQNATKDLLEWVKPYKYFENLNLDQNYLIGVKYILCNISTFHFIELPTSDDDFKVVILVPNETDVLHTLFRRLVNEGLTSALTRIQPMFKTVNKFEPPTIDISSETEISSNQIESKLFKGYATQFGHVKINNTGADMSILTCLFSGISRPPLLLEEKEVIKKAPFFFALIFRDVAIFTGQYVI